MDRPSLITAWLLVVCFSFFFTVASGHVSDLSQWRPGQEDLNNTRSHPIPAYRLWHWLFLRKWYNPLIRPVVDVKTVTTVKLCIALHILRDLVENQSKMSVSVWLRLSWKDELLNWNLSDFAGLKEIKISSRSIWIPDIALMNSLDSRRRSTEIMAENTVATVQHDGTVTLGTPAIVETSCNLYLLKFPLDAQSCPIVLGSWGYPAHHINFTTCPGGADIGNFQENSGFELLRVPSRLTLDEHNSGQWSKVHFDVHIRRRPLYVLYTAVMPNTCLLAMGFVVFLLPPECGERVGFSVTLVLGMVLFLQLVAGTLPPDESLPVLVQVYGSNVILLSLVTILSILTVNMHYRGLQNHKVPRWLRKLTFCFLSRLICVGRWVEEHKEARTKRQNIDFAFRNNKIFNERDYKDIWNHLAGGDTDGSNESWSDQESWQSRGGIGARARNQGALPTAAYAKSINVLRSRAASMRTEDLLRELARLEACLRKIARGVNRLQRVVDEMARGETHQTERLLEWKLISRIIDRTMFLIFAAVALTMLLICFMLYFSVVTM